jgi:hypothetical protein
MKPLGVETQLCFEDKITAKAPRRPKRSISAKTREFNKYFIRDDVNDTFSLMCFILSVSLVVTLRSSPGIAPGDNDLHHFKYRN